MTDYLTMDEYKAELDRLRRIGLTIDPTTAETTYQYRDVRGSYQKGQAVQCVM